VERTPVAPLLGLLETPERPILVVVAVVEAALPLRLLTLAAQAALAS
jgi:hypothetical protein